MKYCQPETRTGGRRGNGARAGEVLTFAISQNRRESLVEKVRRDMGNELELRCRAIYNPKNERGKS